MTAPIIRTLEELQSLHPETLLGYYHPQNNWFMLSVWEALIDHEEVGQETFPLVVFLDGPTVDATIKALKGETE